MKPQLRLCKAAALALTATLLLASCGGKGRGGESAASSGDSAIISQAQADGSSRGEDIVGISERWHKIPITSAELAAKGAKGEGGQWKLQIRCDPTDGDLVFACVDVAGIYKSTDSGKNWVQANVGLNSRGTSDVAVDPRNKNHVIAVGGNSEPHQANGLYVSFDCAETWKQTLSAKIAGYRDFRDSLAFDPTSYDEEKGMCMTAYWSRIANRDWDTYLQRETVDALYRTDDGGETWQKVADKFGDSVIKVHPTKGYVYIARLDGFYKSTDKGATFRKVLDGSYTGADVVASKPDNVYLSSHDGVHVSTDAGETFKLVKSSSYPSGKANDASYIKVSPADPNRMTVSKMSSDYSNALFYTHDGGKTWKQSTQDGSLSFLPVNNRECVACWHPKNKDIVYGLVGGDIISRSTDGAKTFVYSGSGDHGMTALGKTHLSISNPDIFYFGSQDYNGAITTDGMKTWDYVNISGYGWGGYANNTYAVDAKTLIAARCEWANDTRYLYMSYDGGKTWEDKKLVVSGLGTSYADPKNSNTLFCGEYRSTDKGKTWKKMDGCQGVLTYSAGDDKALFGADGYNVVKSTDGGKTWQNVKSLAGAVMDLAYDHVNDYIYAVTGSNLYRISGKDGALKDLTGKFPRNQYNTAVLRTVAIDPVDTKVLYAGGSGDLYMNDTGVCRSLDGGETWQVLTRNTRNSSVKEGYGAGWEPLNLMVHPKTRELIVADQCFGWSRFDAPAGK